MSSGLTVSDFDKICRTCLEFKEDMVSLSSEGVTEMVQNCTRINIVNIDTFPNQICTQCYEKIYEFYAFQQKCQEFDNLLHKISDEIEADSKNWYTDLPFKTEDIEPPEDSEMLEDKTLIDFNSDSSVEENEKPTSEQDMEIFDMETLCCKICNCGVDNEEALIKHMEIHTKAENCDVCGKQYFNKGALRLHKLQHLTTCECTECGTTFPNPNTLSNHMRKIHEAKPLSCNFCQRKYYVQSLLDLHKDSHIKKEYNCHFCDKSFTFPFYLKQHLSKHITDRLFSCLQCDKRFKNIEALRSHQKRIHSERNETICNVCGKSVRYLRHHMLKHIEEKPFKCSYCPRTFQTVGLLNNHSRHTHELVKEKAFLCSVCAKQCTSQGELRIHMRMHTGEKPYQCELCDKSYKTKCALVRHTRSHTGDRPYTCVVCEKGFFDTSTLKRHMYIHTGEKPYECTVCGKSFNQTSILKNHMKVHCNNNKLEN